MKTAITSALTLIGIAAIAIGIQQFAQINVIKSEDEMKNTPAKVYYVKEITPENLIKIYDALGVELKGNVGVKVSTGEAGSRGYLKPDLIGPLVQKLNGTYCRMRNRLDWEQQNTN